MKKKCLLIPENMLSGIELQDVYAPERGDSSGTAGKLSDEEEIRYDEISKKYFGDVNAGKNIRNKDGEYFSVSVKFRREEKDLLHAAITACGYEGISDWIRTSYKRLLLKEIEILKGER